MKFTLSTDTSCDVLRNELTQDDIRYVPLTYTIKGETIGDEFCHDEEYEAFYDILAKGALPTTSQINAFLHEEYFDSILGKNGGGDIVHLSLSGGLSATYNSACIGAKNSMEKFAGSNIYVVDTLSATQGHRFLLDEAKKMRDEGLAADEVAKRLDEFKYNIQHWLIADDLMHLKRGGRVNGLAAYIGTVLNIKPVIAIDEIGKLSVISRVKGIKNGLKYFVQMMEKYGEDISGSTVYIASANCPALAEELKELVQSKYQCDVKIGWIGPIIGAHTGGGTIGIVFRAKQRVKNIP